MTKHPPIGISDAEWHELMAIPEVREGWGLDHDSSVEDFKSLVYGVKFDYLTGGPGYVGDLYIIQGDDLRSLLLFIRKDGALNPLAQ
jgi:hypothetical protein